MNSLRILVVHRDREKSEQICSALTSASHLALPAHSLEEACEALSVQKFDAVLVGPTVAESCLEQLRQRFHVPALYLTEPFEPAAFAAAVSGGESRESGGEELTVFELEQFQEQVGHDPELAAEIIDLFFSESSQQMPAMQDALGRGDYSRLRTVAHTIKGSFGSLHAPCARARAQKLETAAAEENANLCGTLLQALEADLEVLKPKLVAARGGGVP
jgi:HPt (histidine-containing phosphotransfer) domain-containing protein